MNICHASSCEGLSAERQVAYSKMVLHQVAAESFLSSTTILGMNFGIPSDDAVTREFLGVVLAGFGTESEILIIA